MKKNLSSDTKGKSFLYVFFEKDTDYKFIKIGVVTHAKTDEHIKGHESYTASTHPVSIKRRILKLQTGNPNQIEALAYFMYDSKIEARSVERKLHKHFVSKINPHSKEWFNLSNEDIKNIIEQLKDGSINKIADCCQAKDFWNEDVDFLQVI
jgi:hypothetical protein